MGSYSKFDIMGQGRQSWGESEISGCLWKGNGSYFSSWSTVGAQW